MPPSHEASSVKRRGGVLQEPSRPAPAKRPDTRAAHAQVVAASAVAVPSAVEIRAFGLEDRAEAVMARGKTDWALSNLAKWRRDTFGALDGGTGRQHSASSSSSSSSKEYLRQRQRAYRQQCLSAPSASHGQSKTNETIGNK